MSPESEMTCQQAGTKRSFARYRLLGRIRPTLAETRLPIIRMGPLEYRTRVLWIPRVASA
jgi:hypothetical protein